MTLFRCQYKNGDLIHLQTPNYLPMKTTITIVLFLALFGNLPCLAQIALNGTIQGYHNGEEVVIDYSNVNAESGTVSTFIDANGVFTATIPLDPAIPGEFTACADVCAGSTNCHYHLWQENESTYAFDYYTCSSEAVVLYGVSLNMEYPDGINMEEINGDGGSTGAVVQNDGHFSASLWVAPVVAGAMQISWLDCNDALVVDTLAWTEPDSIYNIAVNGCPEPGAMTKVTISGTLQGMLTPINMSHSGNGYTDALIVTEAMEGHYSLILYNMPPAGSQDICFVDCTGTEQCTTVSWSEGNTEIIQNFNYCPNNNPAPCSAEFEVMDYSLYEEPNTVYIILPETYAVSYMWDFGDGSAYSFEQFATHFYNWEGTYTLCLNAQCVDGTYLDYCEDITLNSDGTVGGGGSAMQPFTLYVIAAPTAVGEIESSITDMKIYPNPSAGATSITWTSVHASVSTISILNSIGQVISQEKIISREGINSHVLDVSALESGYYVVKVENDKGQSTTSALIR